MQKAVLGLIGLNLLLVGCLAVVLTRDRPSKPAATGELPSSDTHTDTRPKTAARDHAKEASQKPLWESIAARDLRAYAANLRQVGCPEQTITEIMLAEVNRLYGPQERALKVRPDDVPPWETAARADQRSGETKLRQLLEEKRSLLKELTGVDTGIDTPSRLAGRDMGSFQAAFNSLPEDKRDQVRAIQEAYWAKSDEIKQRTVGYLEPEDREDFVRIKAERRAELAKILTPQELQDYEMKTAATTPALRSRFEGFQVTDEEFRKIFDYMQPLDEQYSLSRRNPDPVNTEFTAARNQAEKDLLEQIHQVLGDERYTEYQRTRDPAYRTLNEIGSDVGASKDAVLQAYQAQQQMQEEAKQVLQNTNLTPEQRTQSLQEMRLQAEQRFQQIFGDKAPQVLDRLGINRMAQRYGLPATTTEANLNRINVNPVPTSQP
jgi:hypothetical protein